MASQSPNKEIDQLQNYIRDLRKSSLSAEELTKKIEDLSLILQWVEKKKVVNVHELDSLKSQFEELRHKVVAPKKERSHKNKYKEVVSHFTLTRNQLIAGVAGFLTVGALSIGSYLLVRAQTTINQISKSEFKMEGKMLAFRGNLIDTNGEPIDSKVDVTFQLYDSASSGPPIFIGRCVGVNGITPSLDGSFKVILGKDCGMKPIPDTILNSYNNLYLGITVGKNKELSPRYPITTVGYAKNTEQVRGMTLGVEESTIPYIDEEGSLVIGALSPHLKSTRGDFSIEGQTLVLKTAEASQGSIFLSPDAGGNTVVEQGKVGIGTDAPETELDVRGNMSASGDMYYNGDDTAIYQANGGSITFYTSSDVNDLTTPTFRINGADSPGIEVDGMIKAEQGLVFTGSQPKIASENKRDFFIGDANTGNIFLQSAEKVGILTTQLVEAITVGGNVAPSKNDSYTLGSEKRKWSTVYTSDLVLDAEGVGGFLRRKSGNLAPTNLEDTLLLGSETVQNASIKLSPGNGTTSWIASGLLGVGTKNPHYTFSALSRTANSSAVSLSNLATTDTSATNVLRLQLGTGATGVNARFIDFYAGATDDNTGKRVGGIRLQNNGVVYETSGADFAEYMKVNGRTEVGDVVGIGTDGIGLITPEKRTIGVITDVAGFVGNAGDPDGKTLVGLQGQIKTRINTLQGFPVPGMPVTASDIPGYAALLTEEGEGVGLILDSADEIAHSLSNDQCPKEYRSLQDNTGKLVQCGRLTLLVSPRWYDGASAKNDENITSGNAVLPAQTGYVKISTSAVDEKSVILVTPYGETDVQLRVAERGKGYFIIKGGEKNITDVDFGWTVAR